MGTFVGAQEIRKGKRPTGDWKGQECTRAGGLLSRARQGPFDIADFVCSEFIRRFGCGTKGLCITRLLSQTAAMKSMRPAR